MYLTNFDTWQNDLKSIQSLVLVAVRDGLREDPERCKACLSLTNDRVYRRLSQLSRSEIDSLSDELGNQLLFMLNENGIETKLMEAMGCERTELTVANPDWLKKLIELQKTVLLIYRDAFRNHFDIACVFFGVRNVRAGKLLAQMDLGHIEMLNARCCESLLFRIDESYQSEVLINRITDGSSIGDVEMIKMARMSINLNMNELRV